MELINKSIKEKIIKINKLALNIGYKLQLEQKKQLAKEENNLVWKLIDFLYEKEFNILENKCSLNASLNFDMAKWEYKIDNDYKKLLEIEKRLTVN